MEPNPRDFVMAKQELWYLSFCDPSLAPPVEEQVPGGPSWLGGCYIEAESFVHAVMRTHELGINPGGEVAGYGPAPISLTDDQKEKWLDRLLTKDEVSAMDDEITAPS